MIWKVWDYEHKKWFHIVVIGNSVYGLNPFSRLLHELEKCNLDNSNFWVIIAWILLLVAIPHR